MLAIIIIVILSIIIIYIWHKLYYLSRYSIFLENEYFHFINTLYKASYEEREKMLSKARKTSLYRKIRLDNSDSLDRMRMMFEDNKD